MYPNITKYMNIKQDDKQSIFIVGGLVFCYIPQLVSTPKTTLPTARGVSVSPIDPISLLSSDDELPDITVKTTKRVCLQYGGNS